MSSPDFFDEETHSRLALEANGGVCSILVSNILIQAQRQQSTGSVVEVYNPDTKDFTLLSTENNGTYTLSTSIQRTFKIKCIPS